MHLMRELLEESRLLTVLYDNLPDDVKTSGLYEDMAGYVERYTVYNNISAEKAVEFYTNYIAAYNKHCKQFIKTSKYPLANGDVGFETGRLEYDMVLLLSVLFTPHRFRIMQLIQSSPQTGKALFIGLGPGLEIMLTKHKYSEVHAYDLSVNSFLPFQFPDISFFNQLYVGQNNAYFDAIYLIELLEHVERPVDLLEICAASLKKAGIYF